MSYVEINQRNWGMPWGGMPNDAILGKLEETDLRFWRNGPSDAVEPRADLADAEMMPAGYYADEDPAKAYMRGEIVDYRPDAPYFEADHAWRDPAISRSVINLRETGTRAVNGDILPRHSEVFYGFTGNDERGSDTEPRLDLMRTQYGLVPQDTLQMSRGGRVVPPGRQALTHRPRGGRLLVREQVMGQNNDGSEADRPWTGPEFAAGFQNVHARLKRDLRVFGVSKEGRPWGRNVTLRPEEGLRTIRVIGTDNRVDTHVGVQASDADGVAPARRDYAFRAGSDADIRMRETMRDTVLPDQGRDGRVHGAGMLHAGTAAVARAGDDEQLHDATSHSDVAAAPRATQLAMSMANAARLARSVRTGDNVTLARHGTDEMQETARTVAVAAGDVARARRAQREDAARLVAGADEDGSDAARGVAVPQNAALGGRRGMARGADVPRFMNDAAIQVARSTRAKTTLRPAVARALGVAAAPEAGAVQFAADAQSARAGHDGGDATRARHLATPAAGASWATSAAAGGQYTVARYNHATRESREHAKRMRDAAARIEAGVLRDQTIAVDTNGTPLPIGRGAATEYAAYADATFTAVGTDTERREAGVMSSAPRHGRLSASHGTENAMSGEMDGIETRI